MTKRCSKLSSSMLFRFPPPKELNTISVFTTSDARSDFDMDCADGKDVCKNSENYCDRELVLQRQAEERAALKKRHEKMRNGVPRKDRVGRQRIVEDAAAEEKQLLEAQAVERDELGISQSQITHEFAQLAVADYTAGVGEKSQNQANPEGVARGESKAARRRRKKAQQEAESQRRIDEEKAKMGSSARMVELDAINQQLTLGNLRIHHVAADGHCLFSAIAHQMKVHNMTSTISPSVEGLRCAVSDHLLKNREEFMPFIDGVNGDNSAFERYCEQLRNTASWGGQVELNVLATVLRTPIEVYAANLPVLRMGENYAKGDNNNSLRVSFHRRYYGLGEHYNSVVPQNSPGIDS